MFFFPQETKHCLISSLQIFIHCGFPPTRLPLRFLFAFFSSSSTHSFAAALEKEQLRRRGMWWGVKTGHCDNPLRGIYNPHQIEKTVYLFVSHCRFFFSKVWFKQVLSESSAPTEGAAKQWWDPASFHLLLLPHPPSHTYTHLNLISQGILAIQNPVNLCKVMPCWWWSLKAIWDNRSNTKENTKRLWSIVVGLFSLLLMPTVHPHPHFLCSWYLPCYLTQWKWHILGRGEKLLSHLPVTQITWVNTRGARYCRHGICRCWR